MSGSVARRICRPCDGKKHTQCDNVLRDDARCPCPCLVDGKTAFWALEETARHWPHVMAARVLIERSLRVCS